MLASIIPGSDGDRVFAGLARNLLGTNSERLVHMGKSRRRSVEERQFTIFEYIDRQKLKKLSASLQGLDRRRKRKIAFDDQIVSRGALSRADAALLLGVPCV